MKYGIGALKAVKGYVGPTREWEVVTLTVNCQEKKSRSVSVKQSVSDRINPAGASGDTSDVDVGPLSAEEIAKNVQSLKAKMKGGKRRGVRDG